MENVFFAILAFNSERAIEKRRPGHKEKHYTLLLAISDQEKNGVIRSKLVKGGVN
jgi:hypothetical protein